MHPAADNRRPTVLLAMGPGIAERLFADHHRARLCALARTDPQLIAHDLAAPTPEVAAALADADVLMTCWGAPPLTAEVLGTAPRLRAVVHAAGPSGTTSPRRAGSAASP